MIRGLILMTALPVTVGHVHLVEFAKRYLATTGEDWVLDVVVSSRSHEPMPGTVRRAALAAEVTRLTGLEIRDDLRTYGEPHFEVRVLLHEDDHAPQSPSGPLDVGFWDYWKSTVGHVTGYTGGGQVVFASEPYGADLAHVLGGTWVPCDVKREQVTARATEVRLDALRNYGELAKPLRKLMCKTVTVFGAESCGKTTLARALGSCEALGSPGWVPEWARQYLEAVGPEVTPEKMLTIVRGQNAAQEVASTRDVPVVVRDTDLLSTLGYYCLWPSKLAVPHYLPDLALDKAADLYVVCPSRGVQFEPDALRYGGDRRESTDEYWVDWLKKSGLRYHVLESTDPEERLWEAVHVVTELYHERWNLRDFRRE